MVFIKESQTYHFIFRFEFEDGTADDSLFVFGNIPELGNWNEEQAKQLDHISPKIYTLSGIELPCQFEYKYFLKTSTGIKKWEENKSRIFNFDEMEQRRNENKFNPSEPILEICLIDKHATTETILNICKKKWWKECTVYQIYPRSFHDSNGDGVGDLRGIISKLDYIKELGIDVIWLSPVYKSPNDDNGYDISDYCEINPEFGTMKDYDEMLAEAHKRNIKIVMDLVVNHTSDEHRWFQEAKKSKVNPYRDYYIWRPPHPETGKEPSNWASFFGGSTWEYDETTNEYYLHLFSKKQPDLNWENPKLREEIFNMMNFWLKKGVDGFRMDVINVISKDSTFPNVLESSDSPYHWAGEYFVNGPRLMEYLQEMKSKVLSKNDVITVGETPFFKVEDGARLTNENNGVLNMLFHFELMDVDTIPGKEKWNFKPWKLDSIRDIMSGWQLELHGKGWNSLYLENHDQPRSVSRFGDDKKYRKESAKMLATWLHMMQGTPYIYQGQEIGMTNAYYKTIDEYRDIETKNFYEEATTIRKLLPDKVIDSIQKKSRDNARTPVQWDDSENSGFSTGNPWIGVNPNYKYINVKESISDSDSIFHYYQKLIKLRKSNDVVVYGTYIPIINGHQQIYAYLRTLKDKALLVIANFSGETPKFDIPKPETFECSSSELLISNYPSKESFERSFNMKPYESRVYLLNNLKYVHKFLLD